MTWAGATAIYISKSGPITIPLGQYNGGSGVFVVATALRIDNEAVKGQSIESLVMDTMPGPDAGGTYCSTK